MRSQSFGTPGRGGRLTPASVAIPRRVTMLTALLASGTLVAQAPATRPDSARRPAAPREYRAVRATGPIDVDGRLDDAAWRGAPVTPRGAAHRSPPTSP